MKPAYLAVCAIIKDETPYLREWLELHRMVGVERFYLYDNGSSDGLAEVILPYVESGVVNLIPWPLHPGQLPAYGDHLERSAERGYPDRWVAFLDADEFLFSPCVRDVRDVLRIRERWAGVAVNWCVFGDGGHLHRPPGLVTENYVLRAADDHPINDHVKSIVDPRRVLGGADPHYFPPDQGQAIVNTEGTLVTGPFSDPQLAGLRVHHYISKSVEEAEEKLQRERSDNGELRPRAALLSPEFNAKLDKTILPLARELRDSLTWP